MEQEDGTMRLIRPIAEGPILTKAQLIEKLTQSQEVSAQTLDLLKNELDDYSDSLEDDMRKVEAMIAQHQQVHTSIG